MRSLGFEYEFIVASGTIDYRLRHSSDRHSANACQMGRKHAIPNFTEEPIHHRIHPPSHLPQLLSWRIPSHPVTEAI